MRILVLSDTHIPVASKIIPTSIIEEAKKCELCLHVGDFVEYSVFKQLSSYVKTVGVCGNMDSNEVKLKLPQKEIVKVGDTNIGLIHGRGAPLNLISFVNAEFRNERKFIDIFIFGHSHNPLKKKIDGKIYFNPGSPTDKFFAPYNSYGIIEIENRVINLEIIRLGKN
jgi:hypothetical protein